MNFFAMQEIFDIFFFLILKIYSKNYASKRNYCIYAFTVQVSLSLSAWMISNVCWKITIWTICFSRIKIKFCKRIVSYKGRDVIMIGSLQVKIDIHFYSFNFQLPVVDPFLEKVSLSDLGKFFLLLWLFTLCFELRLIFWDWSFECLSTFSWMNNVACN